MMSQRSRLWLKVVFVVKSHDWTPSLEWRRVVRFVEVGLSSPSQTLTIVKSSFWLSFEFIQCFAAFVEGNTFSETDCYDHCLMQSYQVRRINSNLLFATVLLPLSPTLSTILQRLVSIHSPSQTPKRNAHPKTLNFSILYTKITKSFDPQNRPDIDTHRKNAP